MSWFVHPQTPLASSACCKHTVWTLGEHWGWYSEAPNKTGSLSEPGPHWLAGGLVSNPRNLLVLAPCSWVLGLLPWVSGPSMDSGDLNSGPHLCAACALLMDWAISTAPDVCDIGCVSMKNCYEKTWKQVSEWWGIPNNMWPTVLLYGEECLLECASSLHTFLRMRYWQDSISQITEVYHLRNESYFVSICIGKVSLTYLVFPCFANSMC